MMSPTSESDRSHEELLMELEELREELARLRRASARESGVAIRESVGRALREHEEKFRLILDAVPALISYVDSAQRYRFMNRAYDAWFGRSRHEFYGKSLQEVLGAESYEEVREHVEEALRGEEVRYEKELSYPDGTKRHISVASIPDFDEHGRVRGFVNLVRDLTQKKLAEVALHEAEQRAIRDYQQLLGRLTGLAETIGTARDHLTVFRDLRDFALASVPCIGIFISLYDPESDVRLAKYAWGDGREFDVSDLPPMPVSAEGPNSRAVRTGQVVITNDYWNVKQKGAGQRGVLVGPDNGLRPQSSLVVPMATMGRIVGTIEVQSYENVAYRDEHVTAMRMAANLAAVAIENMRLLGHESRAREAAEESNRLKDEFLATLSHELRTPLTAIIGWSNMLRSGRLKEETARTALDVIERNARTQQQIIEDILDVSRVITGKLSMSLRPVNLASVVRAALDTVRPAASAKNIELREHCEPRAGEIIGDAGRLQQVVWNLLSNAVKFTPPGGRVEVRVEQRDGHARMTVSDTGPGIKPEFLPYVFHRFRQADQSTTRNFGGLGLGLAIVRHLTELHGGTVSVESEGVGKGASFVVELPSAGPPQAESSGASEEAAHDDDAAEAGSSSQLLEGLRVLVAEDEPDALSLIETVLRQGGAEVWGATSAAAALELFPRVRPDVLVSDIGMPGEDGYWLLRHVRELGPGRGGALPAVALTAYAGEADRERILEAGFDLYVPKPMDPSDLVAVVARAAGRNDGEPVAS